MATLPGCQCPRNGSAYSKAHRYCPVCTAVVLAQGASSSAAVLAQAAALPLCTLDLPDVLTTAPQRSPYWPYRNKLEWRYSQVLAQWQEEGKIVQWRYEAIRLALGHRQTLLMDFWLRMPPTLADPRPQLHDTKGFLRRGWLEKAKAAAKEYGEEFRFFVVRSEYNEWQWEEIPPA